MKNFLILILSGTSFFLKAQGIVFTDTSWSALLQMAREQNKPVFIDAYTTWCGPCKAMARQVFPDSAVGAFYNASFINAKLDMEKGEGPMIGERYKVGCYPSYLFIDSAGNLLHRSAGMMGRQEFIEVARTAFDADRRFSTREQRFLRGEKDPQIVISFLEASAGNCLPVNESAVNYLSSVPAPELAKKENWNILRNFVSDVNSPPFTFLVSNRGLFVQAYGDTTVDEKIYATYLDKAYSMVYSKEKPDPKALESLRSELGALPFPRAGELQLMVDLALAEQRNRWSEYFRVAGVLAGNQRSNDYHFLNSVGYTVFEHSYNKKELAEALAWAKRSVEIRAESFNLDTYACLLWKNGRKEEAVATQEKAIAIARANGEDTGDLEETLRKIRENNW